MEGFGVLRAAALAGVPARRGARRLERRRRARPRALAHRRGARRARREPCPSLLEVLACLSCRAPLPPAERTVGQFIAETIRAYGDHFWRALPLGVPLAIVDQLSLGHSATRRRSCCLAFSPLIAAAFVWACQLVHGTRADADRASSLAVLDLRCPCRSCARLSCCRASRGSRSSGSPCRPRWSSGSASAPRSSADASSALADYVHALGSLAALVIVVGVAELTLIALLRSQGDNGQRVAHASRRPRAQPAALSSAAPCSISTRQPG